MRNGNKWKVERDGERENEEKRKLRERWISILTETRIWISMNYTSIGKWNDLGKSYWVLQF